MLPKTVEVTAQTVDERTHVCSSHFLSYGPAESNRLPLSLRHPYLSCCPASPIPAKSRGTRHSFATFLIISLTATTTGAGSYAASAEWVADPTNAVLSGFHVNFECRHWRQLSAASAPCLSPDRTHVLIEDATRIVTDRIVSNRLWYAMPARFVRGTR